MDVRMTITGRQTLDSQCDVTEIIVSGQMWPMPDGWELRYQQKENGEIIHSRVRIADGWMEVERRGSAASTLRLVAGQRQESEYETGYGCLHVGLETDFLSCDLTPTGGRVEARYKMDINRAMTADHELVIVVEGANTVCQK